ncbi:MAG: AIPR family protein [Sulfurovaceae bacterium]|nr:AIPR family protein [Sulfurovaceae bacterium]
MISLEEFHQDFLQSILSDAESRGLMRSKSFFENVCEELLTTGDLTNNYTEAEYKKTGIEVHGYDYDEERQILSLLVHQFFQEDELQTLTKNQIDVKFKRLRTFYTKCSEGIYEQMEPAYESYSMAYNIFQWINDRKINRVRLVLLTDGKATRNLKELPSETIDGMELEFRVIDIEYLYKIYLSENNSGDFDVDVKIPCLQINTPSNEYQAYLSYLSGDTLVNIYEKFGQKLFEQNVRTFLQFRGNVNKGLRNTIEYSSEMFFAYNNGITATATGVEIDDSNNITKIKNFQIVNGGQTTSAIYAASKNSKLDVSNVTVQMKLSVVKDNEKQNDFVSKVSEYANTQNKINQSDFFSNSPFHKEFKDYSKRVWVSATGGSQRRTHWFYERVRGEYLNEQAYLTKSQKDQFQLENPKHQLIDKTFLAKSETVWLEKPYIASKGAQYSFSEFAKIITDRLEKDNLSITEKYFKDSICRIIIFRSIEKMISQASWYNGGYRAQAVAYAIAYLSYIIEQKNKFLNFDIIWENQKLPEQLLDILKVIAEAVYDNITNPPEGNANVGQWCKKTLCWDEVKKLELDLDISDDLLIDKEGQKYNKKEAKKEKKLDTDIEIQSFVINLDKEKWKKLLEYYQKDELKFTISPMQTDILTKYVLGYILPPSPKQAKILYQLFYDAINDGCIL